MPLSVRIRRARLGSKLTQQQLARLVGVDRSSVAHWEIEGRSTPTITHLGAIAEHTGTRTEWLLTGRGVMGIGQEHQPPAVDLAEMAETDQEALLLKDFRKLRPRTRDAIAEMIRKIAQ